MNFYIADDDPDTIDLLSDLIENDFNNSIVGVADNPQQAYDDLLRLHVDIMLVDYGMPVMSGIQLIEKLKAANSQPHFIMMSSVSDAKTRTAAYQAGIDFFLEKPINLAETKHIIRLIAGYTLMTDKLNRIFELVGSSAPYHLPQSQQRQQVDRIKSILRFLGITAETGCQDIIRIISLMVDQKLGFSDIDFASVLHFDAHTKKIVFQRIRRALKVGLNNLANMFLDYPENEILMEHANNLFGYKNVHNEVLKLKGVQNNGGQISLQHFFDGLLQESIIEK